MPQIGRRFIFVVCVLVVGWWLGWTFLSRAIEQNSKLQKEIGTFKKQIADLKKQIYYPREAENLEAENQALQEKLNNLAAQISYSEPTPQSSSVAEFLGVCERKMLSIKQIANYKGIKIRDKSLGFGGEMPDTLPKKYWVCLDLASQIAENILRIAERKDLKAILQISYPELRRTNGQGKRFLNSHRIRISLRGTFHFALKVVHYFSRHRTPEEYSTVPFLSINQAQIIRPKKSRKDGMVQISLTFHAWQLEPKASLETPITPTQKKQPQIPVWERY